MPKRRILFTSHTANFHKFNRPLMRMLRGKLEAPYDDLNMGGWQVDYACACEEKVYDADNVYTVDFSRSPLRFDKHAKAYRQLKKILAENDYDAIHTHTPVGSIITRLAARTARKKGTKVIYTSHGFHFYDGAPKKNWLIYFRAEKMAAKYTDLLITINREDFKNAKKYFSCPAALVFVAVFFGLAIYNTPGSTAVKATDFQAGRIIDDEIFYNKDTMTVAEIQAFLDAKTPACDVWGQKPLGAARYHAWGTAPASMKRADYAKWRREVGGDSRYHDPPYVCVNLYYENPTTHETNFDTNFETKEGMLSAAEIIYQAAHEASKGLLDSRSRRALSAINCCCCTIKIGRVSFDATEPPPY